MDSGTITEAQFLLTELQYTLGQLHVQLADMDDETRRSTMCADRSVEQVLQDMSSAETQYQSEYARLLNLTVKTGETADHVALPVSDEVQQPGAQTTFEQLRTHTLELLQGTDANWTQEVLDLVKQQVSQDRRETTQ